MTRLTDDAHSEILDVLRAGDWAVDATVGNGHDTLMLAAAVGPGGRVFGFDIQPEALDAARTRLAGLAQVSLLCAGHETMVDALPTGASGRLKAVMFNLGYLPRADKSVITTPATTIPAIEQALALLAAGGRMTVLVYPGHAGGRAEADAVQCHVDALGGGFAVRTRNRANARASDPFLVVVDKR